MMLKDKVIFVTGGAKGIGYGIARAVLDAGARVAAFLLSDHAGIIREQSINADGGDTPY